MTRPSALDAYLRSLARFGMKPGLERIARLLEALGNPHQRFEVVHIAGSNGKGSTATFIAGALQAAGYKVGLFTSPHLQRYNERIRVQGEPITDAALEGVLERVRPHADRVMDDVGSPTEFEVGTALAFQHFADEGVQVAVIETGLGGRLDATNMVDPLLSVITPITIDHAETLGGTIAAIAGEKAGIIKRGRPVVFAPQTDEALQVLAARARELKAPASLVLPLQSPAVTLPAHRFSEERVDRTGGLVRVKFADGGEGLYTVGMLGRHQLVNAAVAASALRELARELPGITDDAVATSLRTAKVAGRLELIEGAPAYLLDGAHNPLGAECLAEALERFFADRTIGLLVGVSKDKPAGEILQRLVPKAKHVVVTEPSHTRLGSWSASELARIAEQLGRGSVRAVPDVQEALRYTADLVGPDGLVCITGSLYLVGEVRSLILREG